MNRFRLLEAMPRRDFTDYTGLPESVVRPQIEAALNAGEISETATHWQITEHGKLFLNTLLERFYKTKTRPLSRPDEIADKAG